MRKNFRFERIHKEAGMTPTEYARSVKARGARRQSDVYPGT